jgi:methylmalonyl-CoA/ethylmalonyl-CoA epimerase
MPRFEFDHVAVAVHAIKPALRLFKDALGGDFLMGGEERGETWRWFQLKYPGGKMELLEPLREGFLSKFLSERGEGLHHVTFKTDNIVEAITHVESLGFELVDKHLDNPDWKEAFFRPSNSHGTLIQIAQSSQPDEVVSRFARPSNLDDLLS